MLQVCIRKKIVRAALTMGITAATMGLSGCVLTQPTDPYAPVSPDQTIGSGPRETVRPSPQTHTLHIPIQGPLTIAIAIETAMANNPEIAAVKWEAATAQARYDAARAAQWPDVRAETGWQHHLDDQRLIPAGYNGEPGIFDPDIVRGDLVLRMPLFTGGRISSEIRAAELLRLAEEKRLARSGEALVFNVCPWKNTTNRCPSCWQPRRRPGWTCCAQKCGWPISGRPCCRHKTFWRPKNGCW
ncbi:MAG: TolC family protein [Desulfobacteraceae bacterium]|nr:TolC family protein [Desulfobacteraceae bacterium]